MTSGFVAKKDFDWASVTAQQFQHDSGLTHVNISPDALQKLDVKTTIDGRFVAVIFIKTPIHNDWGIAHALEHLTFRRSQYYPQADTLFQLTSLSQIKVNASTLDGLTCFHCSSPDNQGLALTLHYLLSGILFPVISQTELEQEVFAGNNKGVIYRELSGYESNPDYLQHVQILKGDQSKYRICCYGGITDSLHNLTVGGLIEYHKQYYRPDNIQLFTITNSPADIHAHLSPLLNQAVQQSSNQAPPDTAAPNLSSTTVPTCHSSLPTKHFPQKQQTTKPLPERDTAKTCSVKPNVSKTIIPKAGDQNVYTWWIDLKYRSDIEFNIDTLTAVISEKHGKLVTLSFDSNPLNQFALRVISAPEHIDDIHRLVVQTLLKPHNQRLETQREIQSNNKYSAATRLLMQLHTVHYTANNSSTNSTLEQQISHSPSMSQLVPVAPLAKPITHSKEARTVIPAPEQDNTLCQSLLRSLSPAFSPNYDKNHWQSFTVVEFCSPINVSALCSTLNNHYHFDAIAFSNLLIIDTSYHETPSLSTDIISKLLEQTPQCTKPNIPSVLHQLHSQLGQPLVSKIQSSSSFRIISDRELKESKHQSKFNVSVTSGLCAYSQDSWLTRVLIETEVRLTARLASYIIGAAAVFLQPRLMGECYSIAVCYADESDELILYSAFDINTEQRAEHTAQSLKRLAQDSAFISESLILAKNKLRKLYQTKFQGFSPHQLANLSLAFQTVYDFQELEYQLEAISEQTMSDFLHKLSRVING